MKRKVDVIAQDLLNQVVEGDIEPGDVLPPETELAEAYGVRRGVVREAIKFLEVQGLVRPVRRKGTEVLDPSLSTSPAVLKAMLLPRPGEIDIDLLDGILEVMQYSDGHMLVLAAERRTEADIARMTEALESMRDTIGQPQPFFEASIDFSRALAQATQNSFIGITTNWYVDIVRSIQHIYLVVAPPNEFTVSARARTLENVIAQNVEGARAHSKRMWEWARPRLVAAARLSAPGTLEDVFTKEDEQ